MEAAPEWAPALARWRKHRGAIYFGWPILHAGNDFRLDQRNSSIGRRTRRFRSSDADHPVGEQSLVHQHSRQRFSRWRDPRADSAGAGTFGAAVAGDRGMWTVAIVAPAPLALKHRQRFSKNANPRGFAFFCSPSGLEEECSRQEAI